MYTDKQRQQIAEEQYENYNFDSVGEEVTIGKGKDGIHIGYVSEVIDDSPFSIAQRLISKEQTR